VEAEVTNKIFEKVEKNWERKYKILRNKTQF
jgi:hypothetical protein